MKHTLRKGFTLIEIMVVISIIASLASVILVGVKAAQANGRDSARQSSALQVRNALALYATDHGGVPSGAGVAGCTPTTSGGVTSYVCKGDLGSGVLKPLVDGGYISHIPIDMINTNGLEYSYVTAATTGMTPGANGTSVAITPTASFDYVSEFKSTDPVTAPVVVPTNIGEENYAMYPSGGYPSPLIVVMPTISSLTAPSTLVVNTSGTWTVNAHNPAGITLNYLLNWGDSTTDLLVSSSSSFTAYHAYTAAGSYTASVGISGFGSTVTASNATVVTAPVLQLLTVSTQGMPGFADSGIYASYGGGGTVTSSVGGITCQISNYFGNKFPCSSSVTGSVTLTATTGSGSLFDGWAGDCASYGTSTTCILDMSVPRTVIAYFDPRWSLVDFGQYNPWSYSNSICSNNFGANYANTTGWHMPTRAELQAGLLSGALMQPTRLSQLQTASYWTGEEDPNRSGYAYACSETWTMMGGIPSNPTTYCGSRRETYVSSSLAYTRCVR